MTTPQKRKFIRDLTGSIAKSILANVPRMPEQWDGWELRQYIADTFNSNIHVGRTLRELSRKRERDYTNEVITRNL